MWMTLKNIVWKESSQTREDTYCMVSFITKSRTSKEKKSIVIKTRNTEVHLQCLVSVYLSLVKIKYSVCGKKKRNTEVPMFKITIYS